MKKIIILAILFIFIIIFVILMRLEDKNPPTISLNNDELTYREGDDEAVLLNDVTAEDDKDGDVTKSITIESIQLLPDGVSVRVSYAAKDSNNNIAKIDKIYPYENKDQAQANELAATGVPIIHLNTTRVTLPLGGNFKPMEYVEEAIDDVDNAWRLVHIDGDYDMNAAGEYVLKYSITDLEGNQSEVVELVLVVG